MAKLIVLGSTEVADLIGIQATLLNKFVERKQYGIEASIRQAGGGRGKERLFGERDAYGIALVHWLFESGLRSQVIQRVLDDIYKVKGAKASYAAAVLLNQKAEAIVVCRQPRAAPDVDGPKQKTELCTLKEAAAKIARDDGRVVVFVPVGKLFAKLKTDLGAR